MSRTLTALFDSRADAQASADNLRQLGIDADDIHIHDNTTAGDSTREGLGLWATIKNAFLPDEDRYTYEEGVRRGGFLLTADVDETQVDQAIRVLDAANTVDIDERSSTWRAEGWAAPATAGMGDQVTEERIPVVEEKLQVGKREVERGGARVRSYVTEVPVHEQLRLREERVRVERRPVDKPLSEAEGDAFRERTVNVTAMSEEPVVAKAARVVEEVVVSKVAGERTEEIDETVRRTNVDVDRDDNVDDDDRRNLR